MTSVDVSARRGSPTEGRAEARVATAWSGVERGVAIVAGTSVTAWTGLEGSTLWRTGRGVAVALTTYALLQVAASGSRRARGMSLLALGLPATAIGLAVAPPHFAKEGTTLPAVLGAFALVAGLFLVGAGATHLVGSMVRGRRTLTAGGVAVSLLFSLYVTVPGLAAVNVPDTDHRVTPADIGLAAEHVSFVTSDEVRLHGWYVPSDNGAAVVVRHGSGSTSSSTLDQAAVLAAHGFGVLLVDARGHGGSGGRAMDFGWYGDVDTRAAVDFLTRRSDVRPDAIGGLGLSMGGEELVGAGAADDRIRAIVAEGVTGRTSSDHAWFSDAYGVRGSVQEGLEWVQSSFTDLLTDAGRPTSLWTAAAAGPPTLLIAAGTVQDERQVAVRLAAAHPSTVRTWTVDGATHTGGLDADPAGWESRVIGFLEDQLLG